MAPFCCVRAEQPSVGLNTTTASVIGVDPCGGHGDDQFRCHATEVMPSSHSNRGVVRAIRVLDLLGNQG